MARKTLIFLLFIYFSIISCSSNKKNHENNIFEVIIENKRSEAVYTQKLAGYSLHYGENEKNLYISTSSKRRQSGS
jgi:thioredoxin-related protein